MQREAGLLGWWVGEDADYAGHSLKLLERIGAALNLRLEVHFVSLRARRKIPA